MLTSPLLIGLYHSYTSFPHNKIPEIKYFKNEYNYKKHTNKTRLIKVRRVDRTKKWRVEYGTRWQRDVLTKKSKWIALFCFFPTNRNTHLSG
jgi:hypothetical protein